MANNIIYNQNYRSRVPACYFQERRQSFSSWPVFLIYQQKKRWTTSLEVLSTRLLCQCYITENNLVVKRERVHIHLPDVMKIWQKNCLQTAIAKAKVNCWKDWNAYTLKHICRIAEWPKWRGNWWPTKLNKTQNNSLLCKSNVAFKTSSLSTGSTSYIYIQ